MCWENRSESRCYATRHPDIQHGDLVRERVAEEHGVDARQDEDLVGRFATEQRAEHGQGVVAKWLINDLREFEQSNSESADVVLIDGLRSVDEMQVLREELSEFLLVYVFAPFEDRIDRIIERGRGSEAEFIGDDGVVDREKAVEYLSNRDAREIHGDCRRLWMRNCTTSGWITRSLWRHFMILLTVFWVKSN